MQLKYTNNLIIALTLLTMLIFNLSADVFSQSISPHLSFASGSPSAMTQSLQLKNQIGGTVRAVHIAGDRAYIGQGPRLRILDISNPDKPSLLGQTAPLDGLINDIVVKSEIAYVALSHDFGSHEGHSRTAGLQTLNIVDPTQPTLLDFEATTGAAKGLFVTEQFAYIADGEEGVWVIDIANPAELKIHGGRNPEAGSVNNLYVENDRLYVANGTDGLLLLDETNPRILSELGFWQVQDVEVYDVVAMENRAYLATGDTGLYILDATNVQNITLIGQLALENALAVAIDQQRNVAYIANGQAGLAVVDLANAATPKLLHEVTLGDQAMQIQFATPTLYVADRGGGFSILDVTNLAQPPSVRSTFEATGAIRSIHIQDQIAYVGTDQELLIYDLAQPERPTELSRTSGLKNGHALAIEGDMLYIADGYPSGEFHMVNVSDPRQPVTFGRLPGVVLGLDIYVKDSVAYVANHGDGLQIIDVSNPNRPAALGQYPVEREAVGVTVIDNHAFVADTFHGTHVVDVSIPSLPNKVATIDAPDLARRFQNVGNQLYIAGSYDGFTIADITNPQQPTALGSLAHGGSPTQDLVVQGQMAYVVERSAGLRLVDISTLANPTAITSYNTAGTAQDVQLYGNTIYVADSEGGLLIFETVESDDVSTPAPTSTAQPTAASTPVATATSTPIATTASPMATPANPETGYEPNNACNQAQTISVNGISQEHIFQERADIDWVQFQATANTMYRIEVIVPADSPADVNLELYPDCDSAPDNSWSESFSPSVRLDFTAPTTGSVYLRLSNHRASTFGDHVAYQLSIRSLANDSGNRAAIIVAGRQWEEDRLQKNIHHVTNRIYKTFQAYDYSDDDIYYLATDSELKGYDSAADLHNLRVAITDWAATRLSAGGVLNLYMIDHGNIDALYLDREANQTLKSTDLNSWLSDLEEKVADLKINVIIEACQSGSFISPAGGTISGPGRLVITSTDDRHDAKASSEGAHFSDQFITWLHQGFNVATSFEQARETAQRAFAYQQAWIDADGNGLPNESADRNIAAQRGFNLAGTFNSNWPPYIFSAEPPQSLENFRGTLYADVRDDESVELVYATIYPPSYEPPATSNELQAEILDQIILAPQSNPTDLHSQNDAAQGTRYGGNYNFVESGTYRILIHAEDPQGLSARPVEIIFDTEGQNKLFLPLIIR